MLIELPMSVHRTHTSFSHAALPMSVMQTYGYRAWIQYNLLALHSWRVPAGPVYVGYPRLHTYRSVLRERLFSCEYVASEHDLMSFICSALADRQYLTVFLDRSKPGGFFLGPEKGAPFLHEVLLYGVDSDAGYFRALDFDESGRFGYRVYSIADVLEAIRHGVELYSETLQFSAQTICRRHYDTNYNPSTHLLDLTREFAEGRMVPIAQDWWENAVHPDPRWKYVYGSEVFHNRLILTERFHGGGSFLQNAQVAEEHARSALELFESVIGDRTPCPYLDRYRRLIQDLYALKLTILRFRLHGRKDPYYSTPDVWQKTSSDVFYHVAQILETAAQSAPKTASQVHDSLCGRS